VIRTMTAGAMLALAVVIPVADAQAQDGAIGGAIVGGAIGGIIGGAATGRAGGAAAGAIIGGAAGGRRGGYYWYRGNCYYRYPNGDWARVRRRYC
jgi:hypothetical protein